MTFREKSRNLDIVKAAIESRANCAYLERDVEARSGRLIRLPEREEIAVPVEVELVVEFYSR